MIFTRPGRCRYGIPSHTVPLRALVLFIFDTDRIVSLVCGAGSMKRSSLYLSVRPSVCPVDRQQHRLLAGLLLSAVRAAYQLQVPSSNGTAARRSAANAGSVTRSHSFSVLMPLSVGISRSRNLQCPIKAQNVDYGRSQFWKRKFSSTTSKIFISQKKLCCVFCRNLYS